MYTMFIFAKRYFIILYKNLFLFRIKDNKISNNNNNNNNNEYYRKKNNNYKNI